MFNCQCSLSLFSHKRLLILYHTCQILSTTFFNLFFRLFQVRSCFFATAITYYHIFMILSTCFLIFLSCFLSRCSAHATACLYYHYFPGMSTPILKYFLNCLKQLKQFTIIYNSDTDANLPTVLWTHK